MTSKPPSQMDWAAMLARFDADADVGVSDKELDGVVAGDVDVATLQARLDADEASAARLQVLQDEQKQLASVVDNVLQRAQAQLLQEQEAEQKAAVTKERPGLLASVSSSWLSSWKRLFAVGAPLAAAAAILLVPMLREPTSSTTTDDVLPHGVRSKGSVLDLTVMRGDQQLPSVKSGATVFPGDKLQFVRTNADKDHFLLVAIDNNGKAMAVHPFNARGSISVGFANKQTLNRSLVLDDEIVVERVIGFFSTKPFTIDEVQGVLDRHLSVAAKSSLPQALTDQQLRTVDWPWTAHVFVLNKVASKSTQDDPSGGTP